MSVTMSRKNNYTLSKEERESLSEMKVLYKGQAPVKVYPREISVGTFNEFFEEEEEFFNWFKREYYNYEYNTLPNRLISKMNIKIG